MSKPNPLDVAAIRAAESQLDQVDRSLNGARDALRVAGALETRRPGAYPLPRMSRRLTAYRDRLLGTGMASEIADLQIEMLLQKGSVLRARETELRAALADLDAEIATYHATTRQQLAPLEADVERLVAATTAAVERLEGTRIARDSGFTARLGARRQQILCELQAPHRPEYQLDAWRAPQPGDEPIAPMRPSDQS